MGVDMHVREDALTESPAPVALCSNSLRPSAAGFEISPLTFVFSVFQFLDLADLSRTLATCISNELGRNPSSSC